MTSIALTVDLTEALDLEMILQAVAVSPLIDKDSAALINRLRRQLDEAVAAIPDEEFEAALK